MSLLVVVRIPFDSAPWFFPLLSLGEWLLLPLGAASMTMGLLSLWKVRERTLLPLWISTILPGVFWLAAAGLTMLLNGATQAGGDLFLAWAVHLLFPTLAFLPLLAQPAWRDRLMWSLAAGVAVNAALIFLQGRRSGLTPPDPGLMSLGGLLANQFDYALMLAIALPLLAAWRGGETGKRQALATMLCTFLLPALALSACFSWAGLAAAAIGLTISWTAWRRPAWIMGVFICLLLFGYGSGPRGERDLRQRRLVAASTGLGAEKYDHAFTCFIDKPYLGHGPEEFLVGDDKRPAVAPFPWYACLLGGTGLIGLGLWLALLGEAGVRAMGRHGRRCLFYGGVLGAAAGLGVAGFWTDALPEGAGALVGLLLAISMLEEDVPAQSVRRQEQRRRLRRVTAIIAKVRGDTHSLPRDNPPEA